MNDVYLTNWLAYSPFDVILTTGGPIAPGTAQILRMLMGMGL